MATKQTNVPKKLRAKFERCVKQVKSDGKTKEQAIAICFNSVVKESSVGTKKNGKKTKSSRQDKKARQKERKDTEALVEFTEEEKETPEETEEEKSHFVETVIVPGPTSFDELEAERKAEKQARAVRGVAFDAEDLVVNILRKPEMNPSQKETALKRVASDFGNRVRMAMAATKEIELTLEDKEFIAFALAATDQSVWDSLVEKAKLTSASSNNLPDSAFACITSGGKKDDGGKTKPRSLRHFPIHDKAHVRNALARASQSLKKGGEAAKTARCAIPKIRAAAKKLGIGAPSEKQNNGLLIQKDKNGDWRWIGWVSNNFKDRDGDIITEKAHQEFVQFLDNNPENAPRFWPWHTKEGERKHRADWWSYENGFLLMSGKLTEKEADSLLRVASTRRLGMSHGFVAARDPHEPHLIKMYRSFEGSDLPLKHAANAFTDIDAILQQEAKTMSEDKRKYLTELLGEDQAARILKDTEEAQKTLDDAGIENKDVEDEKDNEKEVTPDAKDVLDTKEFIAEIAKQVAEALELDKLSAWVTEVSKSLESLPVIVKAVDEIQKDSDEKLADMIEAPASKATYAWSQSESKSDENVSGDGDDEDLKTVVKDGEHWLSELTGTTPLVDANRELAGGIRQ